ncbi:MAG: hypothetical protein GTN86_03820 [Xanthomonadales bacterium]|nr:hypothetical protein [Xanthomonadales bacterium]NIN59146.1 hypothetical protein [Xanthomonadales bacterium]NIN74457.1 hypothetical protein [Xanthomonadales bacterium]NIO13260.1 hypothetical protein [Xanthomonadales bacterium]NIP11539.1 hypothetical protein [Xanthomonadales bacterium]
MNPAAQAPPRWLPGALAALLCLLASVAAHGSEVYLLRHAEKEPDLPDPGLTAAGRQRTEHWAAWFAGLGITEVWSTDYRRTRDTARPIARAAGVALHFYDPDKPRQFVARLQASPAAKAVVVGHSNTLPELAALLCACPVAPMDDAEHDRLMLIRSDASGPVLLTRRQAELALP